MIKAASLLQQCLPINYKIMIYITILLMLKIYFIIFTREPASKIQTSKSSKR